MISTLERHGNSRHVVKMCGETGGEGLPECVVLSGVFFRMPAG